jgi:hypothetical protein
MATMKKNKTYEHWSEKIIRPKQKIKQHKPTRKQMGNESVPNVLAVPASLVLMFNNTNIIWYGNRIGNSKLTDY